MKRGISVFTAVVLSAIMLAGCSGYDFSQKELTEAIGTSKSAVDKLEIQPDDNGDTGNELMEQAKNMGGGFDFYTYWLENGSGYDIAGLDFASGKVCSVSLMTVEASRSDYTVLGIRTGDSRSSAVSAAEAYFGESGSALSDDTEMWALSEQRSDMITYGNGNHKKGMLYIYIDVESDTVYKIEYSKF